MMVKKFKDFVNENVRGLLVGKSMDDINKLWSDLDVSSLDDLLSHYYDNELDSDFLPTVQQFRDMSNNPIHELEMNHNYELPYEYLPSEDDVKNYVLKLDHNQRILTVLELSLDFDLLPRNEEGVCVYKGELYSNEFMDNPIHSIPDDFTVNGDLTLTRLENLPENLTVNGDLNINNNYIKKIPKTLFVMGDMYCQRNEVKLELPEGATVIGKFVN